MKTPLVVTKQTKTTTNSFSSEITAKTEEQQAKTTGSKANVIVVSRGAKEGLQAFIQTQKYKFTHKLLSISLVLNTIVQI